MGHFKRERASSRCTQTLKIANLFSHVYTSVGALAFVVTHSRCQLDNCFDLTIYYFGVEEVRRAEKKIRTVRYDIAAGLEIRRGKCPKFYRLLRYHHRADEYFRRNVSSSSNMKFLLYMAHMNSL